MTREAFEAALDAGLLQTKILYRDGEKWYTCRRNGRTRVWKRDPSRFEIPVKFRFRDTMRVTSNHFYSGEVDRWFRINTIPGVRILNLDDMGQVHDAIAEATGEPPTN